jgi:hypothetical protein
MAQSTDATRPKEAERAARAAVEASLPKVTACSSAAALLLDRVPGRWLVAGWNAPVHARELALIVGSVSLEDDAPPGSCGAAFVALGGDSAASWARAIEHGARALAEDGAMMVLVCHGARSKPPSLRSAAWRRTIAAAGLVETERFVVLPGANTPAVVATRNERVLRSLLAMGLIPRRRFTRRLKEAFVARLLASGRFETFVGGDTLVRLDRRAPASRPELASILNSNGSTKLSIFTHDATTGLPRTLRRAVFVRHPLVHFARHDDENLRSVQRWIGARPEITEFLPWLGEPEDHAGLEVFSQRVIQGSPLNWKIQRAGRRWKDDDTLGVVERMLEWHVRFQTAARPPFPPGLPALAPELGEPASEVPEPLHRHAADYVNPERLQHGDLSCRNVFDHGPGRPVGVIDWDKAAVGLPIFFDPFLFLTSVGLVLDRYESVMYGRTPFHTQLRRLFVEAARRLDLDAESGAGAYWFLRFLWVKTNTSQWIARRLGIEGGDVSLAPAWIRAHDRYYRGWLQIHLKRHADHFLAGTRE